MKLGIIVDGPGDYEALNCRFRHHARIRMTDGPRGHSVPIRKLVHGARRQVSLLAAEGCNVIILMFDFECRRENYDTFVGAVRTEISRAGFRTEMHPCCPNRMIENWYLADLEEISRQKAFIRDNLRQRPFEGLHGKEELKRQMVAGVKYNERKHGQQLFKCIRLEIAERNSSSLAAFLHIVDSAGVDWRSL